MFAGKKKKKKKKNGFSIHKKSIIEIGVLEERLGSE
jgi:hypothetical protein